MTSTASASDSDQAFLGVAALLFVASAATTIVWCASMSAMGGMAMPGGWTMSMAWMRSCCNDGHRDEVHDAND